MSEPFLFSLFHFAEERIKQNGWETQHVICCLPTYLLLPSASVGSADWQLLIDMVLRAEVMPISTTAVWSEVESKKISGPFHCTWLLSRKQDLMTGVMFMSWWLQMTTAGDMEQVATVAAAQPQSHELWRGEAQNRETPFFCGTETETAATPGSPGVTLQQSRQRDLLQRLQMTYLDPQACMAEGTAKFSRAHREEFPDTEQWHPL